jgi:competence protein ComEC
MQPVYNWVYVKNKLLDFIWKMNAVTIAAQVLTVPISIYHFHQFPNFFLLTNIIAVPLSSLIVLGEILLCAISFMQPVAFITGKILYGLIWFMNTWIERIEILPFSLWDGLYIGIIQTVLATITIGAVSYWLLEKKKKALLTGMIALLAFITLRSVSLIEAQNQEKIIVYNVPQHSAIDIITGRNYRFFGDTALENDDFTRNFHLKPSRIMQRVSKADEGGNYQNGELYFSFNNNHILMIDKPVSFNKPADKQTIDLLIISKNPKFYIPQLAHNFTIRQVVFDGSVPAWKSKYWKKDCDSLHIPNHDVSEKGAFVMNLR